MADVRSMTTGQVAAATGLSPSAVRRAAHQGLLRATMTPGGHLKFNPNDVAEYRGESVVRTSLRWEDKFSGVPERWTPSEPGDMLVGEYLGFRSIEVQDDSGQISEARYYEVRDDSGTIWEISGSTMVRRCFADVAPGTLVRLVFRGSIPSRTEGFNPLKDFSLQIAK